MNTQLVNLLVQIIESLTNQGIFDEDVFTFTTQQEQAVEYGKQSVTTYHP